MLITDKRVYELVMYVAGLETGRQIPKDIRMELDISLHELLRLRKWKNRLDKFAQPQSTPSTRINEIIDLLDEWISVDDGSNKEFIGKIQDVLKQMILERITRDTDVKTLCNMYLRNKKLEVWNKRLVEFLTDDYKRNRVDTHDAYCELTMGRKCSCRHDEIEAEFDALMKEIKESK